MNFDQILPDVNIFDIVFEYLRHVQGDFIKILNFSHIFSRWKAMLLV